MLFVQITIIKERYITLLGEEMPEVREWTWPY
jgi:hypothetical protein